MVEITIIVLIILVVVGAIAISWFVAENRAIWRLEQQTHAYHSRIAVEQKRQIRRLTRERNKWEAAAARVMRVPLTTPKDGSPPQPIRRFVSPTEAIHRHQEAVASDTPPPSMDPTQRVPPAIRKAFLEEAKNGKPEA